MELCLGKIYALSKEHGAHKPAVEHVAQQNRNYVLSPYLLSPNQGPQHLR